LDENKGDLYCGTDNASEEPEHKRLFALCSPMYIGGAKQNE
jgi:hypothetical protein